MPKRIKIGESDLLDEAQIASWAFGFAALGIVFLAGVVAWLG